MAVMRERPYNGANFLVSFGSADGRAAAAGFAEVIFPVFHADATPEGDGAPAAPARGHLILRRGLTGALDLYAWWHKARRGKAPQRRTLKVELLSDDQRTVVMSWRFRNARPVSLHYSPLQAMQGGAVIETLELAFDTVEMA